MIRAVFVIVFCLASFPALAQTQPQQQSPSSVALQITSIIGQWAQAIEALQKQNADLQRDLAAVTKERDELKAKQESGQK
jgi:hypothetical protein